MRKILNETALRAGGKTSENVPALAFEEEGLFYLLRPNIAFCIQAAYESPAIVRGSISQKYRDAV